MIAFSYNVCWFLSAGALYCITKEDFLRCQTLPDDIDKTGFIDETVFKLVTNVQPVHKIVAAYDKVVLLDINGNAYYLKEFDDGESAILLRSNVVDIYQRGTQFQLLTENSQLWSYQLYGSRVVDKYDRPSDIQRVEYTFYYKKFDGYDMSDIPYAELNDGILDLKFNTGSTVTTAINVLSYLDSRRTTQEGYQVYILFKNNEMKHMKYQHRDNASTLGCVTISEASLKDISSMYMCCAKFDEDLLVVVSLDGNVNVYDPIRLNKLWKLPFHMEPNRFKHTKSAYS